MQSPGWLASVTPERKVNTTPVESTETDPDRSVFTVISGLGNKAQAAPTHPSAARRSLGKQIRLTADERENIIIVTCRTGEEFTR
jgi:hypothetical protein